MHPKELFARYMPHRDKIRSHKHLQFLGDRIHDPDLWHLNRRSVAGAVTLGVFLCFMPIPFQMVAAAVLALIFRVNLAISVVCVWISNPITFGPMLLLAYQVGVMILGMPMMHITMDVSITWFSDMLIHIWKPLIVGCVVLGSLCGLIANLMVRWAWRLHLIKMWETRKERRQAKQKSRP